MSFNLHVHATELKNASRIRKEIESVGLSGLYDERAFIGAGIPFRGEFHDSAGKYLVNIISRKSSRESSWVRKAGATLLWYRQARAIALSFKVTTLNCHSVNLLPLCVNLKRRTGCKLIYDTHELETKVAGSRGIRRLHSEWVERKSIKFCDGIITVSDSIADWYQRSYGIGRPTVVRNIPKSVQGSPHRREEIRAKLGFKPHDIVLLYQGHLSRGRNVECLLNTFAKAGSGAKLLVMGYGPLEDQAKRFSEIHPNIFYLPAVPPDDVLHYTAAADVGFAGHLTPDCLNHRYALPNKFFEYILAGLPVLVHDVHEEMARIVNGTGCGWVLPYEKFDLGRWATTLRASEVNRIKDNVFKCQNRFSWENEAEKMIRVYRSLQ